MNNRSKLVGVIVVLLLLLFGWRWWTGRQVKPVEAQEKAATTSPANTVVPNTGKPGASTATSAPPPASRAVDPKVAKIEAIWAGQNAQAQNFYGKVIDQHGEPVVGATALGTLLWIQGVDVGEKREQHTTQTDQNGEFEFTGFHASRLAVAVTKEGYEMGRSPGVYHAPNEQNKTSATERAIFHMWKLHGAEPMVHTSIQAGLACDGTPRKFDPLAERRDAGDLVVTLTRNPVNIDRGKPFDWTLTLGIAGGGLIPINDLYPNEAPADGYQSSVAINMSSDTKNWTPSVVQSYYIFDGKNYGRITIDIMANYQPPPTHFEIDSYVNPAGSRNLEFDPSKQVR
jgi:hypothetical protein